MTASPSSQNKILPAAGVKDSIPRYLGIKHKLHSYLGKINRLMKGSCILINVVQMWIWVATTTVTTDLSYQTNIYCRCCCCCCCCIFVDVLVAMEKPLCKLWKIHKGQMQTITLSNTLSIWISRFCSLSWSFASKISVCISPIFCCCVLTRVRSSRTQLWSWNITSHLMYTINSYDPETSLVI